MKRKTITFTKINTAELLENDVPEIGAYSVLVKTVHSTISAGTEKANITGDMNVSTLPRDESITEPQFPRTCGYCSSGIVEAIGANVKSVAVGDRVAVCWGTHSSYNVVPEGLVFKLPENVSLSEAATCLIATFPLAAIRKTGLEAGESALVMGLGILGAFAVHLLRAVGAYPIIAADPVASRREYALSLGADYALDPFEPDFAQKVKALTEGNGVKTAIEVTGVGQALDTTLDCMAIRGRVALLGCTRDPNFTIDYYRKVHGRGVQLIGAHTNVRPSHDSSPGYFTQRDDMKTLLGFISGGRVNFAQFVNEHVSPEDCGEVFTRLVFDKNFPLGVQFDWQ